MIEWAIGLLAAAGVALIATWYADRRHHHELERLRAMLRQTLRERDQARAEALAKPTTPDG